MHNLSFREEGNFSCNWGGGDGYCILSDPGMSDRNVVITKAFLPQFQFLGFPYLTIQGSSLGSPHTPSTPLDTWPSVTESDHTWSWSCPTILLSQR